MDCVVLALEGHSEAQERLSLPFDIVCPSVWLQGWTFVYATVYVIVVWINYSLTTDCMPYSFLDVGPQLAPVWYVGLVIFLAVIFSAVSGLVACRERWHTGVWPSQTTSEYTPLN